MTIDQPHKMSALKRIGVRQTPQNACNIINAAKEVFIHRNTMINYLVHISDIAGIDLKNGNDLAKMQMSMLLFDLCGP